MSDLASETRPTERDRRFADAIAGLRTRATAVGTERWFRWIGPVLMPLGALVILLGWYGAANTTRLFLQIPYVISGGLLGLGLMFVGGFLFFARWLDDTLHETRRAAAEARESAAATVAALERIESLLRTTAGPATTPAPAAAGLVITRGGNLFHRPDCRLVEGRETRAYAGNGSRRPCGICQPD